MYLMIDFFILKKINFIMVLLVGRSNLCPQNNMNQTSILNLAI